MRSVRRWEAYCFRRWNSTPPDFQTCEKMCLWDDGPADSLYNPLLSTSAPWQWQAFNAGVTPRFVPVKIFDTDTVAETLTDASFGSGLLSQVSSCSRTLMVTGSEPQIACLLCFTNSTPLLVKCMWAGVNERVQPAVGGLFVCLHHLLLEVETMTYSVTHGCEMSGCVRLMSVNSCRYYLWAPDSTPLASDLLRMFWKILQNPGMCTFTSTDPEVWEYCNYSALSSIISVTAPMLRHHLYLLAPCQSTLKEHCAAPQYAPLFSSQRCHTGAVNKKVGFRF